MTREQRNTAILNRFWEEVWNDDDLDVVDELFHPDFVDHGLAPGLTLQGPEGVKEAVGQFRSAFPDMRLTVDDMLIENDTVLTRWTARGTQEGPLAMLPGVPPTGKSGAITGVTLNRLVDGKITEAWDNFDMLGMLFQLGIIPAPAPPVSA